jgi:hypothetical protein
MWFSMANVNKKYIGDSLRIWEVSDAEYIKCIYLLLC